MTVVKSIGGRSVSGKSMSVDEQSYIFARYHEDAFISQIARELGRSRSSVKNLLRSRGLS